MANDRAQLKLDKIISADKASGLLTEKKVYDKMLKDGSPVLSAEKYDIVSFIEDEAEKIKKLKKLVNKKVLYPQNLLKKKP